MKTLKNLYKAKIILGVVLVLGITPFCHAQLTATVYQDFTQVMVNPYLVNPSATDTSYSFKIRANNINELGVIKNVSRFYIDGDKRLNSSQKNNFHFIGIQASNSKIGDYISRSRLQLRYSWYAQLSRKGVLSSGVSLGFINFAFLTTQGGSGGSATGPDGSVGIHYIRPSSSIGFAVQQLFTPVLIPVNQSFRLSRLYNFDVTRLFQISPLTEVTTQAVMQISDQGNVSYSFGFLSNISGLVLVGANNFCLRKTSVNLGLSRIRIFDIDLMVMATYSFYQGAIPLPANRLEIFMSLQK